MTTGLNTPPGVSQKLAATIGLPYTLTTGKAVGSTITALASKRLTGSYCSDCQRTSVPAQDYCVGCGGEMSLIEAADTGTITAATTTPEHTLLLVQIDGASSPLLHRLVGPTEGAVPGARVRAVWADETKALFLDLEGFEVADSEAAASSSPVDTSVEDAMKEMPYRLDLDYQHSYGPYYGRLFDELAHHRRLVGSPCPQCHQVMVPPRERCDVCFARTTRLVEVQDTGTLQAFSIVHLEFVGQTRTPPYVYAEVVLDGSSTRLIHVLGGFEIEKARDLTIGMPVRAVWKDASQAQGTLADIEYFEPVV